MGADLVRGRYDYVDCAVPTPGLPVTTPSRGRRKVGTTKRSIYFFRIDGAAAEDGVPINVNLHPELQKLDGLPFCYAEDGGRYVNSGDADQCVGSMRSARSVRFASPTSGATPCP